jgi:hypothetical protein
MTAICREALAFWAGRDNAADLVLLADDLPVDPTPVTRVVLRLSDTVSVDSNTTPTALDWPVDLTYCGASAKGLRLALGGLSLTAGLYTNVWLVIYDPDHTNGLVWTDSLSLRIT